MSNHQISTKIPRTQPRYVSWRGKLLAQLALARVPGLVVHERPKHAPADFPYDFLVAAEHGACFFVAVNAFASFRMSKRGDIRDADELHWALDADLVRRAQTSRSPFILFLFDADTEHGRYLRLDTLPDPGRKAEFLQVRFPRENTITTENLIGLIADLNLAPKAG